MFQLKNGLIALAFSLLFLVPLSGCLKEKTSDLSPTGIILIGALEDEKEESIDEACSRAFSNYLQSPGYSNSRFSNCSLVEKKIGLNDRECLGNFSVTGCYICVVECK